MAAPRRSLLASTLARGSRLWGVPCDPEEAWRRFNIVTKLALYLSRPEQIPGSDLLTSLLERLTHHIAGASFRDTRQVALRNQTMREIAAAFDKIFSYLESVAAEEDFA